MKYDPEFDVLLGQLTSAYRNYGEMQRRYQERSCSPGQLENTEQLAWNARKQFTDAFGNSDPVAASKFRRIQKHLPQLLAVVEKWASKSGDHRIPMSRNDAELILPDLRSAVLGE